MAPFLFLLLFQPPLESRLARIADQSGGAVGVAALHLESGKSAKLHAADRFPMASVFKLPLALTVLQKVERGASSLSLRIPIRAGDIRPYRSPIAARSPNGGETLSVAQLLDLLLIESDNTAADKLLVESGGAAAVTARMRELGAGGIRVDRSEGEMALDYAGVTNVPPASKWTLDWFLRAISAVPADRQREAAQRALNDDRDTATPESLVFLLRALLEGKALSKDHTALVLDRMRKTVPAAARIKGALPPGTIVAHRPGTGGDNEGVNLCTNDAGIVTLPDGTHIILAVFLKGSPQSLAARERTIAQIARALYDAWSLPQ